MCAPGKLKGIHAAAAAAAGTELRVVVAPRLTSISWETKRVKDGGRRREEWVIDDVGGP